MALILQAKIKDIDFTCRSPRLCGKDKLDSFISKNDLKARFEEFASQGNYSQKDLYCEFFKSLQVDNDFRDRLIYIDPKSFYTYGMIVNDAI